MGKHCVDFIHLKEHVVKKSNPFCNKYSRKG